MAKWFNHRTWIQYQKDIKVKRDEDLDMYLSHIIQIANTFPRHAIAIGVLDINDLIQAGNKGLVEAWGKADKSRPQPELWSFLKKRIKGAIRREIDNNGNIIKIPRRDLEDARANLKHHEKILVNVFPKFFDNELWVDPEPVAYRSVKLEEFLEDTLKEQVKNYRDIDVFFKISGIGQEKITAKKCAELYDMSEAGIKKIKIKINKIIKTEIFAKKLQNFISENDIGGNITYEGINTVIQKLNNANIADYSTKTSGDFRRQLDRDLTYDNIRDKNWESDNNYYNYYHVNGKKTYGRILKARNNDNKN